MMRYKFAVGTVAMAFALSAAPGLAQDRQAQQGSRPAGSSERVGAATPRSDGNSAAPRGGGNEASSPRGGGGMSGGSVGSSSSPSAPSSSGSSVDAPQRSQERAPARPRSGGSTGRSAVPRGGSASSGDRAGSRAPAGVSQGATASEGRSDAPDRRAVPAYSRPRDGRTITGDAIERRGLPSGTSPNVIYYYRPYYTPYGFWGSGFGLGLGYLYYDPFSYGYGSPYYGGGYYGGGYGGGGYYGGGYGGGYYGGSGGYSQSYRETGGLRLKIKPRDAQVFVDGYFVGVVDSFDGTFQRLTIEAGPHRIEIKADGHEPVSFEVLVTPGETLTYRGELKPIQ